MGITGAAHGTGMLRSLPDTVDRDVLVTALADLFGVDRDRLVSVTIGTDEIPNAVVEPVRPWTLDGTNAAVLDAAGLTGCGLKHRMTIGADGIHADGPDGEPITIPWADA